MELIDQRILITGATGQVAGALARSLAERNEVYAFARFSAAGSQLALERAGIKTCRGDFVTNEFDEAPAAVDYVLHSAANTRPKNTEEALRDNVDGLARMMSRYRDARAFLHVSATGCYLGKSDPWYRYKESDDIGGDTPFSPMYGVSKSIAEGVARVLALEFDLPTTIARLNVAYGGPYADGGLPGRQLDAILAGDPIKLPKASPAVLAPIHEDDLSRHIGPLLAAAAVPATVVNWGGDEGVEIETWVRYLGKLVGKEPNISYDDNGLWTSSVPDNSKRLALGCECEVSWQEGMRRMVTARHPEIALQST